MKGDGRDGIDALIAGVQQRFPDFKFTLIGEPNGYGEHVRFSWGLGPDGVDSPIKGTDFAVLEGRPHQERDGISGPGARGRVRRCSLLCSSLAGEGRLP